MINKTKAKSTLPSVPQNIWGKIFHYNFFTKSRTGAMEMSIGTIVTIALLMVVLVMGMYLIRTIMCSGITLTEEISESVKNEVRGLFGVEDYGVRCMGESGHEITLGDGGRRQIVCIINTDTQTDYKLRIKNIESLRGVPTNTVRNWILDEDWEGAVSPGQTTVTVLLLDIPKEVSDTNLKIEIEEDNGLNKKTHISYIDIKHVGTLNSAIC